MPKIVRYEFMGSWFLFWVMSLSMIGIPFAILYLLSGVLRIEQDMEDPERFVDLFRAGRLNKS